MMIIRAPAWCLLGLLLLGLATEARAETAEVASTAASTDLDPMRRAWQLPARTWELRLGGGLRTGRLFVLLDFGLHIAITDSIEFALPLYFTYGRAFGERNRTTVGLGLTSVGVATGEGFTMIDDLRVRHTFDLRENLQLAATIWGRLRLSRVRGSGRIGADLTLVFRPTERLRLALGVGYGPESITDDFSEISVWRTRQIAFGSVSARPVLPQPLLRYRLGDHLWAYLGAEAIYTLGSRVLAYYYDRGIPPDPWSGGEIAYRSGAGAGWSFRSTVGLYIGR